MIFDIAKSVIKKMPAPIQKAALRQYLVRQICSGHPYHEGEICYLPKLISRHDLVWDIGANAGQYAFELARLANEVHAFEPIAYNFETLLRTIKRGRLRNVVAHKLALSDHAGTARMSIPSVPEHSLGTFTEQGEQVEVATVDGLIASGLPAPSFIKCDVEGNGPQVIRGAEKLIREHHPVWLLEVWSDEEITRMETLGYKCFRYPVRGGAIHQVRKREGTTSSYFFIP